MARSPSAGAAEEPGALARVLRAARRRQAGALAVEGALFGLGAAGATAVAAVASGGLATASGTLLASALAGLACGTCWWLERREDAARLARRIDRRTVGDGSFVTAVECERDGRRGALAQALVRRTRGHVGPAEARRAMRPPSVALVALPLLALAALAQLEWGSRSTGESAPAPALDQALEQVVAALAGPAGRGPGGVRDPELERLLAAALEAGARDAGALDPGNRASLREALERLADALGRRLDPGDGPGPGPERREALERALELVRAAGPGHGPRAGAGGPASGGSGSADPKSAAVARERRLDAGEPGVTMSGSPDTEGPDGEAGPPADPGTADAARNPEPGVLVGRTWDARYDGVVDAWLRRSGAASSGAGASEHDFE